MNTYLDGLRTEDTKLLRSNALASKVTRKNVAFDGSAGNGAIGTVALFTVTGTVLVKITPVCTENLVDATATIEVGISGDTATLIAQTTGTDVDANEIWHDATPDADIEAASVMKEFIITNGQDIILTVATAAVSDGTIDFFCFWEALSADGYVE